MSNSATITPDQLRTVLVHTELSGKTGDANHFSYGGLSNSSASFGQMQFDVGANPAAQTFLLNNGFDSDDIAKLSTQGKLSDKDQTTLDTKLKAIPEAAMAQFTSQQMDDTIGRVGDIVDKVRKQNPAAADAIVNDKKLQLGIADYANQFSPGRKNSSDDELAGFLAGKLERGIQAGNPPTRDDMQSFIGRKPYGLNPDNAHAVKGREDRFNEAMAELKLGPPSKASTHNLEKAGSVLKPGSRGEAVGALQADLAYLGYNDSKGRPLKPDNDFGPDTDAAVRAFQRDHGLEQNGVGPKTQHAIQTALAPLKQHDAGLLPAVSAMSSLPSAPGVDDPRNALNPNHGLYEKLQQRIPDASEERLLQFTAACHANKITGENLSTIRLDETNMKMNFHGSSFLSTSATVDLSTPPPQPQHAIQQIQQHDQQQAQMMGQIQAQNAQPNQQATQGPVPGSPGR
jgi:peptidoglycan hydrolase-like protein with peptidoglycan-binding domain